MKVSTVSSDQIWLAVEGHVSAVSEYCASVTMLSRKELTNVIVLVYSISPVSGTMKQINSRSCLHTFLSRLKLRTQQKAVCWTFHMSSYPSWRSSAWGIFSSVSKTEVLFSFLFFFLCVIDSEEDDREPGNGIAQWRLNEQLFPCPVCGKVFGRQQTLSRHLSLHTGERARQHACWRRFAPACGRWLLRWRCPSQQISLTRLDYPPFKEITTAISLTGKTAQLITQIEGCLTQFLHTHDWFPSFPYSLTLW